MITPGLLLLPIRCLGFYSISIHFFTWINSNWCFLCVFNWNKSYCNLIVRDPTVVQQVTCKKLDNAEWGYMKGYIVKMTTLSYACDLKSGGATIISPLNRSSQFFHLRLLYHILVHCIFWILLDIGYCINSMDHSMETVKNGSLVINQLINTEQLIRVV